MPSPQINTTDIQQVTVDVPASWWGEEDQRRGKTWTFDWYGTWEEGSPTFRVIVEAYCPDWPRTTGETRLKAIYGLNRGQVVRTAASLRTHRGMNTERFVRSFVNWNMYEQFRAVSGNSTRPMDVDYWDSMPEGTPAQMNEAFVAVVTELSRLAGDGCSRCGGLDHTEEVGHVPCSVRGCTEEGFRNAMFRYTLWDNPTQQYVGEEFVLCDTHKEPDNIHRRTGHRACDYCGLFTVREQHERAYVRRDRNTNHRRTVCTVCRPSLLDCPSGHLAEGGVQIISREAAALLDIEAGCTACLAMRNLPHRGIGSWDWVPPLVYHPETPTNPKKPLYVGVEVEMAWDANRTNNTLRNVWLAKLPEDLIWAKGDSSVHNGFEVVTHPMEPEWALKSGEFPWDLFDMAIELGAYETHRSCGQHVHMSKEAFTPAHMWKMLQIHIKLPEFCGLVGGRGADHNYGSLNRNIVMDYKTVTRIAKEKGKLPDDFTISRSSGVNLRPNYTIELRYPAGATKSNWIKKNIEWVWALYRFTDYLDVRDVREGALENPGYLMWWLAKHEDDFPNLMEWIDERLPRPVALRERG